MFAQVPPFRFRDFDSKRFGHPLAYALRDIIAAGGINLGATVELTEVTAMLEAGEGRFLLDANRRQLKMVAMADGLWARRRRNDRFQID